ncbi:MAG: PHP domain-containing protein [Clostridia bacterium]|jgi:hypothetical protein|nr:PHP domain-containing protein [Clostridia bacterium]
MDKAILIEQLNAETKDKRLQAVAGLKKLIDKGEITVPCKTVYTNNHVHTKYSFSPYSPAKAVWMAVMAGLSTVGIMDHDAINGAEEFIEAGEILGIATTIGFEIRSDWDETVLAGKRINNPDQVSSAYICAHGVPHTQIAKADAFLSKIRAARGQRNRKMVDKINALVSGLGITLSYDNDVLPLTYAHDGGGVTERHLLFALTLKMIGKYGKGEKLVEVLSSLGITPGQKPLEFLSDAQNDMYEYDLLNVLKSSFIKDIYIDTNTDEAVPISDAVNFIRSIGAIPSYCYLGDVGESPTGDKKAQKFEDDYLTDVLDTVKGIGFPAIAYMPSRNTLPQLRRIMTMADEYGFMQISGEDINQPRQSFICEQLSDPIFAHLTDTTWALVGHEISATQDINNGIFADEKKLREEGLSRLISVFKQIGLSGTGT